MHDSSDGGPDQFIMWQVLGEKVINELNFFDDQITIEVKELTVKIGESKPDGFTNQSFPPNLFSYSNKSNR